jgi:hypothetical protein
VALDRRGGRIRNQRAHLLRSAVAQVAQFIGVDDGVDRLDMRITVSVGDLDREHRAQLGESVNDAGTGLPVDESRLDNQRVPVRLAEQAEEESGYPGAPDDRLGDGRRLAVAVGVEPHVMSEQRFELGQFARVAGGEEPAREFVTAGRRDLEAGIRSNASWVMSSASTTLPTIR